MHSLFSLLHEEFANSCYRFIFRGKFCSFVHDKACVLLLMAKSSYPALGLFYSMYMESIMKTTSHDAQTRELMSIIY